MSVGVPFTGDLKLMAFFSGISSWGIFREASFMQASVFMRCGERLEVNSQIYPKLILVWWHTSLNKTQALSVLMLFCPKSYEISQLRLVFLFCLFMFYYYFKSFVVLLNGCNSASWVQSCERTVRACSRPTHFIIYIKLNTIGTSWWILWALF